jgi:2-phospho-L-lactate guanylyltransferase
VAVVTDDPAAAAGLAALGARIVPDSPAAGLNAALAHGAEVVRAARPAAAVAALNADLPALRTAELARALAAASVFTRAFLTDAAGIGTTLLCARPGAELRPAFGGPSRLAHLASGATEIMSGGLDSVRQDVDTGEDLAAALALGVGRHTADRLAAGAPAVPRKHAGQGH